MNIKIVNELYAELTKLTYKAFDIVFQGQDVDKLGVNKEKMHINMDQYLQCALIKCVLTDKVIPGNYFEIAKNIVEHDMFASIEAHENFSTDDKNYGTLENYINGAVEQIPLFFSLIVHLDSVCKKADPNFDASMSRMAFDCVVEILRNSVENKLSEDKYFPVVLFNVLRPVIELYKTNNLKYDGRE